MKSLSALKFFLPVLIVIFAFTSCDMNENPVGTFEEAVQSVPEVRLIEGADNATINVKYDRNYSYFTVDVSNVGHAGDIRDGVYSAWCIQMEQPLTTNLDHSNTKLYTTVTDKTFNKLSYIVNNRRSYERNLDGLSWKDIQVAFWVIIETSNMNLSQIQDKLPSSVEGYSRDNVNSILSDVKNNGSNFTPGFGDIKLVMANASGNEQDVGLETKSETAFAVKTIMDNGDVVVNTDTSKCFLDFAELATNRWGWTNGPFSSGTYEFDIWAGAAQCDLTKGEKVGTLTLDYNSDNGTATVTYQITKISDWTGELFRFTKTHLYLGNDQFPKDNNDNPTVAPGQYPYSTEHDYDDEKTEVIFNIDGLSGDLWMIAHAVVDGFEPQ